MEYKLKEMEPEEISRYSRIVPKKWSILSMTGFKVVMNVRTGEVLVGKLACLAWKVRSIKSTGDTPKN